MKLDSFTGGDAPALTLEARGAMVRVVWLRQIAAKSSSLLLGCADQAIVSLSSFATLVMVGRWTNPGELGAYAVSVSVLALALATQEALVSRPYTIHLHRPIGTAAEHAFSGLTLSLLLGVLLACVVGAFAVLLSVLHMDNNLIGIVCALAVTIPFVLLREFARRFAFAHLKVAMALQIDTAAAVFMVSAIGALGWTEELTAARAIVAVGAACALATFGWLYFARAQFAWSVQKLVPAVRQSWGIGKWFLSGQLAVQGQGYMVPWLALWFAGAAVTGVYAACASIVAFANPFIYGISNMLTPKYVNILRGNDVGTLRRRVICDSALLAAVLVPFCILISVYGDWIMRLLYNGAEYAGQTDILTLLAVAALVAVVGIPASLALAAAEHARTHAFIKAGGAILTVLLVSALLPWWGILGATYGILIVETVISIAQWVAFLLLVRQTSTPAPQGAASCAARPS